MHYSISTAKSLAVSIALASVVAFVPIQASAEASTDGIMRMAVSAPEVQTVVPMSDAGEALQVTVGHSRLLIGERPFGTIIVGDDTIARASLGPENSLILTGLTSGSTNLIILGEGRELVLSARIAVVPVNGPLRSTVTVFKGGDTRETYECRGGSCQRLANDDEQREVPFVFMAQSEAASAEEPSTE